MDSINETLKSENEKIIAQNRNFHIKRKEAGAGANGSQQRCRFSACIFSAQTSRSQLNLRTVELIRHQPKSNNKGMRIIMKTTFLRFATHEIPDLTMKLSANMESPWGSYGNEHTETRRRSVQGARLCVRKGLYSITRTHTGRAPRTARREKICFENVCPFYPVSTFWEDCFSKIQVSHRGVDAYVRSLVR